jgi:hypothetical protein
MPREELQRALWANGRQWRSVVLIVLAVCITYLGFESIVRITELYDGLCPVQGRGLAIHRFDDSPLGYCTGISHYLSLLGVAVAIAAVAVPGALVLYWRAKVRS